MYADDTTIYFNLEDFDPDNVSNDIHSFIICLFRKHSPYKNCANYA